METGVPGVLGEAAQYLVALENKVDPEHVTVLTRRMVDTTVPEAAAI